MLIEVQSDTLFEKCKSFIAQQGELSNLERITSEFSNTFLYYYEIAQCFADVTDTLMERLAFDMDINLDGSLLELKTADVRSQEYQKHRNMLYKSLSAFVIRIFNQLALLQGDERICVIRDTNVLREKFLTIVDYRHNNKCILMDWSDYQTIREGASIISMMELNQSFSKLYQLRVGLYKTLISLTDTEKEKELQDICMKYNAVFYKYSCYTNSLNFQIILVNHYTNFIDDFLDQDAIAAKVIKSTSGACWNICLKILKRMAVNDQISDSKIDQWKEISSRVRTILKAN